MARARPEQLQLSSKWRDRDISPERTKVWSEPSPRLKPGRKVPVVYYLSRDGHLEHPHFMEVPISSHEGLFLRDVINRLNSLRGKGMGSMYSWSSKRSYKNGFVWHDLCENDFIHPVHGHEYVLKGSELLEGSLGFKAIESEKSPESQGSGENCGSPVVIRSRNHSWSSVDLNEYKVYKSDSTGELSGKAANAATQTDEKKRRRRLIIEEDRVGEGEKIVRFEDEKVTELNREEISPPPSNSSPETLETLIKADGSVICASRRVDQLDSRDRAIGIHSSGRMKASKMLMQLISCGTFSVKSCSGSGSDQGFSLFSQYKHRAYGGPPNQEHKALEESPSFGRIQLEDKEYFSGSLIETRKTEFAALKRSSSYDAERGSKLDLKGAEIDGVRAKCIPRRPKMAPKESCSNTNAS